MRAFRGIGKCVCVYERGRKGASKQLMDWCSLFFFLSCSWAGIHLHMYNTRKRASKLCCLFSLLGNINKNQVFTILPAKQKLYYSFYSIWSNYKHIHMGQKCIHQNQITYTCTIHTCIFSLREKKNTYIHPYVNVHKKRITLYVLVLRMYIHTYSCRSKSEARLGTDSLLSGTSS